MILKKINKVHKIVLATRKVKLQEIADTLKIFLASSRSPIRIATRDEIFCKVLWSIPRLQTVQPERPVFGFVKFLLETLEIIVFGFGLGCFFMV